MATLRTYLDGRAKAEFAGKVGIRPVYLSQLLAGVRKPSLSLMLRIQKETDGEVDLNSWTLMQAASSSHGKPHAPRKRVAQTDRAAS